MYCRTKKQSPKTSSMVTLALSCPFISYVKHSSISKTERTYENKHCTPYTPAACLSVGHEMGSIKKQFGTSCFFLYKLKGIHAERKPGFYGYLQFWWLKKVNSLCQNVLSIRNFSSLFKVRCICGTSAQWELSAVLREVFTV